MRLWSSIYVALGCVVLAGCGDDASPTIDPGPTGAPNLRIVDPAPAATPACVSIGLDASIGVPVLVDLQEMLLRSPGGCFGVAQCGRLALFADEVLNNETAVRSVDLLLYKLGDPYRDGSIHDVTGEPDVLELRVEILSNETDEVMLDRDGEPLADTLQLITVVDCDAAT